VTETQRYKKNKMKKTRQMSKVRTYSELASQQGQVSSVVSSSAGGFSSWKIELEVSNWRTLEVFGVAVLAVSWYSSAATVHTCAATKHALIVTRSWQ